MKTMALRACFWVQGVHGGMQRLLNTLGAMPKKKEKSSIRKVILSKTWNRINRIILGVSVHIAWLATYGHYF